jgi:hypothetical protein
MIASRSRAFSSSLREKTKFVLGCCVLVLLVLVGVVGESWVIDKFDAITRGTWVETILNFITAFYLWIVVLVAVIAIVSGIVGRLRHPRA